MDSQREYNATLKIAYKSEAHARMVQQCLSVDDELQPERVSKELIISDSLLVIKFYAADVKILRVALSSFFDMVTVATKTLQEFE
mmetsp:Transcript_10509/g.15995  ORF Transcript_10509/g.15995 Transcript_10509/m.15995 type:complete len:85 (-) Transcript_10509:162-416(-)